MSEEREFNVKIMQEEGMFWAEVVELPGTFASGETLDELQEALTEAIAMVLDPPKERPAARRPWGPSPPMPMEVTGKVYASA